MTLSEELERLQALRTSGALTEAEYEKAKSAVLGSLSPSSFGDGQPAYHATPETNVLHTLKLSSTDAVIGGVCGGLGASTPMPSWAWRVIFLLGFFSFGIGLIPYVVLWICMPKD
jgi:phage shock protein PspC (stress-responsive transcriptional regulator)